MADLFGIDIAAAVNDSIVAAGNVRAGTLTKVTPGTRTPGDLTGGTNPTTATHSFNGFYEARTVRADGTLARTTMDVVTILGASLSVVPEVNDQATIDGTTWTLTRLISRDPASAVYEFEAQ